MIILISGVGSSGKTLMAQTLLEKYKMPYLSIDHLKMGLYRGDQNCGFTPLDDTEVIGDKLWPILKGIMMTNIENKQNLIIEGAYLLPHYLKDLEDDYAEEIISVFFGFTENYIGKNFEAEIVKNRNAIEYRNHPEERMAAELIAEHKAFKVACLQAGVKYFEINEDYDKEMLAVYDYIDEEIKNRDLLKM